MTAPRVCGAVVITLISLLAGSVEGQEPDRPPVVSFTGGVGNTLGGLGGGLEYYVARSRISAALGLGYWPSDGLCSGILSGAAAVRAFTGGRHHRVFLEGSYSLVQIACFLGSNNVQRDYGPGISAGYRYISEGGFTLTAGAGVADGDDGSVALILLGLGYTWRRQPGER
jgi:hypothetical protein